ncbi:hypothetical protein Rhopal_001279-T1 [Rhodotorula paludigena]|uniref:Uncharacterized protein n=1 Tax=Rhodotorula paludigena TaxID=86838 RepID=A0AAV5GCW4_9BASI|nr:hypothetical protein Rhopal_001279-T1 [Rhodotorula paludigena]
MSIEGTPASDLGDVWGPQAPGSLASKLCAEHGTAKQARKVLIGLLVLNIIYLAFIIEESYSLSARAGMFIRSKTKRYAFFTWQGLLITNELLWSTYTAVMGILIIAKGGDPRVDLPIGWSTAVAIYLSCLAACDLSITVALGVGLRSRIAGFSHQTDSILRQLIWLALRTAAYTTFLAIVGAVLAGIYSVAEIQLTNVTASFWLPLPALHSLAFFSTISSTRHALASSTSAAVAGGGRTGPPSLALRKSTSAPPVHASQPRMAPAGPARSGVQIVVQTHTRIECEDDGDDGDDGLLDGDDFVNGSASGSDPERDVGLRPLRDGRRPPSRAGSRSREALDPDVSRQTVQWDQSR